MCDISFGEYLQQMGEKFRPAAESIQMKEEYLNRTQWARIRIGDSMEGRDGLEPVSRQVGASEGERVKQRRQERSPAGEERGKPQQGGPGRGSPPAEGVHELRRARGESEEAPKPPEPDAPSRGGGVTGAGRAM